jgi:hypothetical protein
MDNLPNGSKTSRLSSNEIVQHALKFLIMKEDLGQFGYNERYAKMTSKKLHSVDTAAYNR